MLIKLQPTQIPAHWELIKFASVQADGVVEEIVPKYSIKLLLELLSGKSECIMSVDEDRQIRKLIIVSIYTDKILDKKYMDMKIGYVFKNTVDTTWKEEFEQIFNYAKRLNCNELVLTTSNPAAGRLVSNYGIKEQSKTFSIQL